MRVEPNWRWSVVTAIAPIAWGSTYFVTRNYLPGDLPLYGAMFRALPAGLILLAVCRTVPHGSWWWKALVLGTLNMSVFFTLAYLAAQLLPSSIAAVIMATASVTMMLMAWVMLRERPGKLPLTGALLGILGVAAMLLPGSEGVTLTGVAASLAAVTVSSFGFVLTKKWGADVPVLASTSWQLTAGGLVLVPAALIVEGPPPSLDAVEISGFAYVSVVATALGFAAWFSGLRHLAAGAVGVIGLLNPVTGVLLGTALASETLSLRQVGGLVLVLTGVVLGQVRRSTNHANGEVSAGHSGHHPQPEAEVHLGAPSGGDVTEVEDVSVAEFAEDLGDRRLGPGVVS